MISHSEPVVLTVPSFLAKLWDMVNDESLQNIISWSKEGNSFVIKEKEKFTLQVLPRYFKHCNLSSFIRQLNKYGFKKVQPIENQKELEFAHNYFLIDDPELLMKIKRKEPESKECNTVESEDVLLKDLFQKVKSLKKTQDIFESKLELVENKSQELWNETMQLKRKQRLQQQIIRNIMRFLVNVMSENEKDNNNISFMFSKNQTNTNKSLIAITEKPHSTRVHPFIKENVEDSGSNESEVNSDFTSSLIQSNGTEVCDYPLMPSAFNSFLSESEKLDSCDINASGTLCMGDSLLSDFSDDDSPVSDLPNLQASNAYTVISAKPKEITVIPPDSYEVILGANNSVNKSLGNDIVFNFDDVNLLPTVEENEKLDLNEFKIPVDDVMDTEDQNSFEIAIPTPKNSTQLVHMPNILENEELGDHINIMESNLNTLKDILSDADLNLDMNEVDSLFFPEEMASLITSEDDSSSIIALEDLDINSLPNNDTIACSEFPGSISTSEDPNIFEQNLGKSPNDPIIILPDEDALSHN